ncbi:single-stranded DNA-binding protein [Pectobacterium phage Jarilo]|uniref:Single-stranded DNA-binding protein n=1 Tax=Pectobacterium phage Jarilo TaxID=2163634 RepID=A0A2S1GT19_9CAUD|nr:Gp2.5-like ssDNA binding protein and ssDNA annealing protein [Pectobacterium phage Jarilo]AWD92496.1 single-stranded DNA-binding protein [Pectobacterium phage Jarilo]
MATFNRPVVLTSGLGITEPYSYLTKPDYGNEAKGFGNPRGIFRVSLTLPTAAKRTQAMIDEIVKCHEEHYAEKLADYEANPPTVQRGKKPLLPYEGDLPFIDNGDGTTTFKFSSYASFQDKKTQETVKRTMLLVDSIGKRIANAPAFIGGGSEIKVKYKLMPYTWNPTVGASVKLQLESVMVVQLAEGGDAGGNGGWGADDAEEGGYQASNQRDDSDDGQQDQQGSAEDEDGDF